ncbi:MAG: hypothetical protein K2L10_04010 [Ruminococcus sp.]|nr:hypothetical protein [Ruminococcus sp.]
MNGYITFWSKEYVKELEKHNDNGKICVVYGSQHQRMPSVSALKIGDVIYPVAIQNRTLCVMARMPVEKIEPAFDYLMRETGHYHSALIPEGILIRSKGTFGEFNMFSDGSGYTGKITLPDNIHTVIDEHSLVPKPHKFHQEPITCCAKLAISSENGSLIFPRPIPVETVAMLKFGKTKSTQKKLHFDKNGNLTSISLSGFVRKMSDETFEIFEKLF